MERLLFFREVFPLGHDPANVPHSSLPRSTLAEIKLFHCLPIIGSCTVHVGYILVQQHA